MTKIIKVVLVDRYGKKTGLKEKYAAHKNPASCHRAISVVLFSPKGNKILLTKRAKSKITWPDLWSNAVCTHPKPGETFTAAANRRLYEELGIKTLLTRRFLLVYKTKMNRIWGENERDWVFTGRYDGPVSPDPDEISGFIWEDVGKIKEQLKKHPEFFTPWFRLIAGRML